ncbi:MAG TPA: MlaD family protein [Abditibacteriaceae bacterium]|jgi:ABC-type transporter Mla subunit MlaD
MKTGNEARVGVVVVAALALALIGYFYLRGTVRGADLYYLRINGPATIAQGNDVRLQGVKIGEVREVALDPETQQPIITIAVKPNKLLRSYQYSIRTNSLIGEPYVDIRGTYNPARAADAYAANNEAQVISGTSPVTVADLSQEATTIGRDFRVTLQKLNVTIDRINKGVLSYQNQVKLARALESVTRLTTEAGKSFGNQGVKISFGDPRAQAGLNRTLENSALAAREAGLAARSVSSSVNALSGGLNGVLAENRGQVRGLLQNLSATAKNVSGLTESLTFVVRQSGFAENSQLAFRSLRRAAENVEASTAGFRTLSNDPGTQQNLRGTIDALRVTTESLRDIAGTISKAVGDPETQAGLRSALVNINATTANIEKATANLADVTGGFKNIVGDPKLQQDLKETAANLNGTLAATRAAAERVNSLLGGRNPRRVRTTEEGSTPDTTTPGTTTPGTATPGTATPDGQRGNGQGRRRRNRENDDRATQASTLPTGVDFTFRHLSDFNGRRRDRDDSARNFGDLTFNAELFGSPVRAGLSNIGEGSDLTLQSGKFIGRNGAVRYGLYRSKLGVGAQYNLGRFSLEGNLYDPNRRSGNVYGGFQITPNLEVLVGREHIGGVHSNSIGVRLRP